MYLQKMFPFILILAVVCRIVTAEQNHTGASGVINPSNTQIATSATESSAEKNKQIDLNKKVLLQTYSDETSRIDAASLLLFDPNPYARKVLIDTLKLTNNSAARMAVCKALIQTRTTQQEIPDKNDFIEPLLNIFTTKVDEEAQLASDAILIFKYQEISSLLDKLVSDPEKPVNTRINVINTLRKIPEMDAILKLYRLADDPNQIVAAESGNAIRSLGFQPGTNSLERKEIVADLEKRGIVAVLRERLVSQDSQINQYKLDLDSLRKFTLSVLDEAYQGIGVDDASRAKFLRNFLTDSRPWVRSWSLDKIQNWRTMPQTSIPAELEPVIISLVSDPLKEIRLKTIDLIGQLQPMKTVDLTTKLLAQFDIEQDDQVKIKLLDILGIVCSTGLSPTASIKISSETRLRVLGYASDFLSKDDPAKAKTGAKVMRQLLERDGMQEQDIKIYLTQLSDKFNKTKQDPNSILIPDLLNQMVGLAADSSACRENARKTFEPCFTEALNYDNDFVRETAIDGLGYINKTNALRNLRGRVETERSEKARLKIIKFAEDVGGRDDLIWLAGRLGSVSNSESKQAWAAMIKIFGSVEIDVLNDWKSQLITPGGKYNLTDLQKIDFLKCMLVNTKTTTKNKQEYYEQIADRYFKIGQYEQAATFYNSYNSTATEEEKISVLPKLLDSYLRMPNEKLASNLIKDYLGNNNINADNPIILTIENYFRDANIAADKNVILKSLNGITLSKQTSIWQTKLKEWNELINKNEMEIPSISKDVE